MAINRTTGIIIAFVAALALFAGGYYVGANTSRAATNPPSGATGGAAAQAGPGGAFVRGGAGAAGGQAASVPVSGRVISVNADSITIAVTGRQPGAGASPAAQTSSIALVGANTRMVRTSESDVKLTDIKTGDQVTIVGTTDPSTGTISANAIVVGVTNVLGQLFGPGGFGGQGGAQTPGGGPRPSGSPGR